MACDKEDRAVILPVEKQPFVLGWFLVIYLALAIFILVEDKRTDFVAVLSTGFRAVAILPLMLFIYCLLFEFK